MTYTNPRFDRRIRSLPLLGSARGGRVQRSSVVTRGRLETESKVNGHMYKLNFLYNPTDITWTGGSESNIVSDASRRPAGDGGQNYLVAMNQQVSFALLFDRTYETWDYDTSKDTSKLGVLADIRILYGMLGILGSVDLEFDGTGATGEGAGGSLNVHEVSKPIPTSFMQWVPMWAIFGPKLSYYGVVDSASVTYSHFTQRLIPNRCAVSLSMSLMPPISSPDKGSVMDAAAVGAAAGSSRTTQNAAQINTPAWNSSQINNKRNAMFGGSGGFLGR